MNTEKNIEVITSDSFGTKWYWEGTGTYVSMNFRGPFEWHKLPEGAVPSKGTRTTQQIERPKPYSPINNRLWTLEN